MFMGSSRFVSGAGTTHPSPLTDMAMPADFRVTRHES